MPSSRGEWIVMSVCLTIVLVFVLLVGTVWVGQTFFSTPPESAVEYSSGDRAACRAVTNWYSQEGPNPSDEEAGRFFMRQSERADSDRVRERLEKEAVNWRYGVETWSPGAQETCAVVLQ